MEDTQKVNGGTVDEQPQKEALEPEGHILTFVFAGPDSTSFQVNRDGVNPFQLAEVLAFLNMVVESEMLQIVAQVAHRVASSQIAVPGRPVPPFSQDPRRRRRR